MIHSLHNAQITCRLEGKVDPFAAPPKKPTPLPPPPKKPPHVVAEKKNEPVRAPANPKKPPNPPPRVKIDVASNPLPLTVRFTAGSRFGTLVDHAFHADLALPFDSGALRSVSFTDKLLHENTGSVVPLLAGDRAENVDLLVLMDKRGVRLGQGSPSSGAFEVQGPNRIGDRGSGRAPRRPRGTRRALDWPWRNIGRGRHPRSRPRFGATQLRFGARARQKGSDRDRRLLDLQR